MYPQPTAVYLQEEVYSEKSGYQANKIKDLSKAIVTDKQKRILKYLKEQKKGIFLDVGCSSGELMYFVKKIGFDVKGVELNPRTANIAKANGLDVEIKMVENANYQENYFDYVHMGDLIEHVADPRKLVDEVQRILKPGGQLIILTPNMECFWSRSTRALWRLFGIPWGVVTPPHHLYQFGAENLKRLLNENGYQFRKAWYTKTPSLKYELGSLHLIKAWKKGRTFRSLVFMIFSFSLYTILFGVNRVLELFPVKRFGMAMVFVKS